MDEYYIFRLSVDNTHILQQVNKLRIIYKMLRSRANFPKFEDYQQANSVFFHGQVDDFIDEFLNFTQFFPKYRFTLWLSYMCRTKLYVIEVQDRKVIKKKLYNESNGLELVNNSRYYPDFNRKNLKMDNEITKYLL